MGADINAASNYTTLGPVRLSSSNCRKKAREDESEDVDEIDRLLERVEGLGKQLARDEGGVAIPIIHGYMVRERQHKIPLIVMKPSTRRTTYGVGIATKGWPCETNTKTTNNKRERHTRTPRQSSSARPPFPAARRQRMDKPSTAWTT